VRGSLHWLSAVARCPQVVGLADHPATFPYVWSLLGWNIHVYHSGHFPAGTPLYGWLKEPDLLDPAYPPLRP
jgi:hypothetical protein